ncbi:transcription factor IBH1-like 1 [Triticum aestivum]|uniref:transcription factor IBH1-like 1 n=1 Tax=Triticum aestivum TaxID=4565 RepID=UPI001D002AFD|nr:transcription factor IBH1-like 1 [Triticum aestivum]
MRAGAPLSIHRHYLPVQVHPVSAQAKEQKQPNACTKSLKQALLKNLLLGLQLQAHTSTTFGGATSLRERKRAIKSSVDVAMAAAHGGVARWPILAPTSSSCKVQRCRRIMRRSYHRKRSWGRSGRAGGDDAAGRLARSRTMALREMIPGGQDSTVDEATLLREAMDYAVHLRAQVNVLRRLSEAVQICSSSD